MLHPNHSWIEGNMPGKAVCAACNKASANPHCLYGYRCAWCQMTVRVLPLCVFVLHTHLFRAAVQVHPRCQSQIDAVCDLGLFRPMILPPYIISMVPSVHTRA
jgi:hypothetical protein